MGIRRGARDDRTSYTLYELSKEGQHLVSGSFLSSPGTMSDSYSKPLDRLTSPGSTLASPLFHSVVYTATQRMDSGRSPEENITEKDMEAVVKVS